MVQPDVLRRFLALIACNNVVDNYYLNQSFATSVKQNVCLLDSNDSNYPSHRIRKLRHISDKKNLQYFPKILVIASYSK